MPVWIGNESDGRSSIGVEAMSLHKGCVLMTECIWGQRLGQMVDIDGRTVCQGPILQNPPPRRIGLHPAMHRLQSNVPCNLSQSRDGIGPRWIGQRRRGRMDGNTDPFQGSQA